MSTTDNMKLLFIVINAGLSDEVMEIAREAGIHGATIWNARGESAHHRSIMGITVDTEKEMIMSVTDEETAERIMAALREKAGVATPAHSVCFVMPVDKVLGLHNL